MLSSYPRACIPLLTRHLPTPTCSAKHRGRTLLMSYGTDAGFTGRNSLQPRQAHSTIAGNLVQRGPEPVTAYVFTGLDVEVGGSRAGVVLDIYTPQ